jgi:cysteine desulfurase
LIPYNIPMSVIYLDNNATTRPDPAVTAAVVDAMEQHWANPSSVHRLGQAVRQRVELARQSLAKLIACRERELIFTSGGTEANNLALRGALSAARGLADSSNAHPPPLNSPLLITTKIEHAAIRQPADTLAAAGLRVVHLPLAPDGSVSPADLHAALAEHASAAPTLVSIQWANNETGLIQPIAQLARVVADFRNNPQPNQPRRTVLFHVDATQAVGKIPVDLSTVSIDMLTLAAHKFHGPKGVGALFVRTGVRLAPQQLGGPQERDRRGGTENTPGIIGMGVAADLARDFLADTMLIESLRAQRDRFERAILAAQPDAVINSLAPAAACGLADHKAKPTNDQRLWNTSNIGFPRLEAEAILLALSEQNLCASAGAACSSGSLEPSPVLLAMGIPEPIAHGSIRFSLSRLTTPDEVDRAITLVPAVVRRLARSMPV